MGLPEDELNEPSVRWTEVVLTSTGKNTLRILNTIRPVTRVFTAIVATKAVRVNVFHQATVEDPRGPGPPGSIFAGLSEVNQVARGII